DSSITAYVPAALAGTVDVTVTSPYGSSSPTSYTYTGTAPTVTALDITEGPTTGDNLVTIIGTNLNGITGVSFGGTAASSFEALLATTIVAKVPALSASTVHVTVTT